MNKTKGFTEEYKKMRYMPGLNSLRAIAVLRNYYLPLKQAMVDRWLFRCEYSFVISGYLITSLLLKEYDDTRYH